MDYFLVFVLALTVFDTIGRGVSACDGEAACAKEVISVECRISNYPAEEKTMSVNETCPEGETFVPAKCSKNSEINGDNVTTEKPTTVGTEPVTTPALTLCMDRTSSCGKMKKFRGFCDSRTNTMTEKMYWCPRTCGLCCADTSEDCAFWNTQEGGFCDSEKFTPLLKIRLCAKTCGFCPPEDLGEE